jgi:hypothetical protein
MTRLAFWPNPSPRLVLKIHPHSTERMEMDAA